MPDSTYSEPLAVEENEKQLKRNKELSKMLEKFDPVLPFIPDGKITAKWAGEAPDFKIEWDY